jgi:hypothetical protein
VLQGRDGVRQGFEKVLGDLPNPQFDVFEDGLIRAQTVRYTLRKD